mgnify:CR=1 FL=1
MARLLSSTGAIKQATPVEPKPAEIILLKAEDWSTFRGAVIMGLGFAVGGLVFSWLSPKRGS